MRVPVMPDDTLDGLALRSGTDKASLLRLNPSLSRSGSSASASSLLHALSSIIVPYNPSLLASQPSSPPPPPSSASSGFNRELEVAIVAFHKSLTKRAPSLPVPSREETIAYLSIANSDLPTALQTYIDDQSWTPTVPHVTPSHT